MLAFVVFAVNVYFLEPVIDSLLFTIALAAGLTPQLRLPMQSPLADFLTDFPVMTITGDSVDPEMIKRPRRRWQRRSFTGEYTCEAGGGLILSACMGCIGNEEVYHAKRFSCWQGIWYRNPCRLELVADLGAGHMEP